MDAAPALPAVLRQYLAWLRSHGLADSEGRRVGHWAMVTWGDGDLMGTLREDTQIESCLMQSPDSDMGWECLLQAPTINRTRLRPPARRMPVSSRSRVSSARDSKLVIPA